ncbi:MAG TPA: F0F1 ATP synthase subunit A [Ignavibacteriaceae bacterium]|nr:F0F1 ATP synthase subunit A [Ignavibacteriaceae bacterium]
MPFNSDSVNTLNTLSDTLAHSDGSESSWILHHIVDANELELPFLGIVPIPQFPLIYGIDFTPTKHILFMWIAALIVVLIFMSVAKSYKKSLVPKGIPNFFEVLIIFVRDEIVKPTIGEGYQKFLPYLLSLFFFVLFGNLLGLIPYSATFTSNIGVTAALAIMSFIMIQFGGMRKNGVIGYLKGLVPHGVPGWMLVIMIPVELLGLFTKPFALAIRLFANMVAGHTVILALIGLIFFMGTIFVAPVSVSFAVFIYLLEILVALIQAYIFTMLTALFIGMAVHQEH